MFIDRHCDLLCNQLVIFLCSLQFTLLPPRHVDFLDQFRFLICVLRLQRLCCTVSPCSVCGHSVSIFCYTLYHWYLPLLPCQRLKKSSNFECRKHSLGRLATFISHKRAGLSLEINICTLNISFCSILDQAWLNVKKLRSLSD